MYRKWDWIEHLDSPQLARLKKILDDGAVRKDVVEVLHKGLVSPSPKPALNLFIFSLW